MGNRPLDIAFTEESNGQIVVCLIKIRFNPQDL